VRNNRKYLSKYLSIRPKNQKLLVENQELVKRNKQLINLKKDLTLPIN